MNSVWRSSYPNKKVGEDYLIFLGFQDTQKFLKLLNCLFFYMLLNLELGTQANGTSLNVSTSVSKVFSFETLLKAKQKQEMFQFIIEWNYTSGKRYKIARPRPVN